MNTSRSNRLTDTIRACNARGDAAFMPFLVIGDPNVEASLTAVDALVAGGADVLEFGFPFSDPPADGPVIQAADVRALEAGVTPDDCFAFLREVRARHDVPVALLIYFNLVLQRGLDRFFAEAAAAGVDAVLVADVPLEELAPLRAAAAPHGVANVCIASALTTDHRLQRLSEQGGGFLYVVSRVGITGERRDLESQLPDLLGRLRTQQSLPALVGFGISTPDHVAQAAAAGADGVICGSAIVRRIAAADGDLSEIHRQLQGFTASMKASTRGAWRPPVDNHRHL